MIQHKFFLEKIRLCEKVKAAIQLDDPYRLQKTRHLNSRIALYKLEISRLITTLDRYSEAKNDQEKADMRVLHESKR